MIYTLSEIDTLLALALSDGKYWSERIAECASVKECGSCMLRLHYIGVTAGEYENARRYA